MAMDKNQVIGEAKERRDWVQRNIDTMSNKKNSENGSNDRIACGYPQIINRESKNAIRNEFGNVLDDQLMTW